MLNSLTPIFVIVTGALFFNTKTTADKVIGICIAFLGSILLMLSNGENLQQQYRQIGFALFVLLATILYGYNVNLYGKLIYNTSNKIIKLHTIF